MNKIELSPIGIIHSPYNEADPVPIQGKFKSNIQATAEIYKQYQRGLKDLDGFSHAILIYFFHRSTKTTLVGKPYLENENHGIFAIRSPHRPNHLGLSIIKIESIIDNKIIFSDVDMFDGTPLLDIKPYSNHFDQRQHVKSGWIDKHFSNGKIPKTLSRIS